MNNGQVVFDHIEVHVGDIPRYAEFLVALFRGGRWKQISESGTAMYISPDGINIEIKAAESSELPAIGRGFCLPCIRLSDARAHLESLGVEMERTIENPEGEVHFFRDVEGIHWHAKDYEHRDRYINW